jgi:predicted nucleic acid-binding protein
LIYLDSSAVVKLVRRESGSAALVAWLGDRSGQGLVSSVLIEVEVPRALHRNAPEALNGVPAVLARVNKLEIDATVRATAGAYAYHSLRSLDAIHLASAQLVQGSVAGLQAFVTYDRRLLSAASELGLVTASPGTQ